MWILLRMHLMVASHADAWIKVLDQVINNTICKVASHADAWIKADAHFHQNTGR